MKKFMALGVVVSALAVAAPAYAQDVDAGANVFKRCGACHSIGEGAKNKVGPELNELFGRVAGTAPDYSYSKAMIEAGQGGLIWSPATLAPYLHKPKEHVPGTKMSFPGLPNQKDIDNLIAYLGTFSPNYVPTAADGAAVADPAAAPADPAAAPAAPADPAAPAAPAAQ
jgi:cytochrome c